MNRRFNPTSRLIRSLFAVAAVAATALVAGSIDGLAQHYETGAQAAGAQPTVLARR